MYLVDDSWGEEDAVKEMIDDLVLLTKHEWEALYKAVLAEAKRRAIDWERIKRDIYHRDKATCQYCGRQNGPMHIDHKMPVSRGGNDHPDNLVVACSHCNLSKGNMTVDEWCQSGRMGRAVNESQWRSEQVSRQWFQRGTRVRLFGKEVGTVISVELGGDGRFRVYVRGDNGTDSIVDSKSLVPLKEARDAEPR